MNDWVMVVLGIMLCVTFLIAFSTVLSFVENRKIIKEKTKLLEKEMDLLYQYGPPKMDGYSPDKTISDILYLNKSLSRNGEPDVNS